MIEQGRIAGINGPVITIRGSKKYQMLEMIFVGHLKLIGEVINIEGQDVIAQVYESTTGLSVGEPVYATGEPMSLELGPGIVGGVFDGIQRPLTTINEKSGVFIGRGLDVVALDRNTKWQVELPIKVGDTLKSGDVYALIQETELVMHKVMLGPNQSGKVIEPRRIR